MIYGTYRKKFKKINLNKKINKLEINMHNLRGNAIPAGPLSDFDEILFH